MDGAGVGCGKQVFKVKVVLAEVDLNAGDSDCRYKIELRTSSSTKALPTLTQCSYL
jgi:hypothetical protein